MGAVFGSLSLPIVAALFTLVPVLFSPTIVVVFGSVEMEDGARISLQPLLVRVGGSVWREVVEEEEREEVADDKIRLFALR